MKSNNNIIFPHSFDITDLDNYIYAPSVIKKIIGTAFSNNEWTPLNVTNQEMDFHLNLADFCCNLTESNQHQLALLLQQLVSTEFKTTRPPTTYNDLRKIYLSGKNSIYKNIPVPKVIEFDDHAYVSITDIVKFSLSALNNLHVILCSTYDNSNVNNQTIGSCQKAHTIIKDVNRKYCNTDIDPYILFVTLWSDDFEVNHTRRNRNSTWIKTITFDATSSMSTSKYHSHIVCLGQKGSNHSTVNAHIKIGRASCRERV